MKILVVGSGGREHSLVWKIAASPLVDQVFVAPGNAGTAAHAENVAVKATDIAGLVKFAQRAKIDLAVIGPEQPLCDGLVDALARVGIRSFGPSKNAARLEGSKVFCKHVLRNADVPTADFQVFYDAMSAKRFILDRYPADRPTAPVVVKADGLAGGKGAIVCSTQDDALAAIDRIAHVREFGAAGDRLIIEDRLKGREVSVMAITDGRTIVMLPPAQDHKRAGDGDTGPNTGGMGAYSPAPWVDDELLAWIEHRVLVPTVHAMNRSRNRFRGVLYAGLMLTNQGVRVLEYNVRFGDPECQPLMMRLKSDLVELMLATVEGRLSQIEPPQWDERPAVSVVMASAGYPSPVETGHPIRGLDEAQQLEDVMVFHSGTARREDGQVVTAGGRVLSVTAIASSVANAKRLAYRAVKLIRWEGAWCRKDIAEQAMQMLDV